MYLEAVHLTNPIVEDHFIRLLKLLPPEYNEKINCMYRKGDRDRALIGALLIRVMVNNLFDIPFNELEIDRNAYGKPYILSPENIYFNISHSGNWVVCALDFSPIGVDIEQVIPIDLAIACKFFTKQESTLISLSPDHLQMEKFYKLWTLKECYVKAIGKGLSISLNSFDLSDGFENESFGVTIQRTKWYFKQYDVDSEYMFSLCASCNEFPEKPVIHSVNRWITQLKSHLLYHGITVNTYPSSEAR